MVEWDSSAPLDEIHQESIMDSPEHSLRKLRGALEGGSEQEEEITCETT